MPSVMNRQLQERVIRKVLKDNSIVPDTFDVAAELDGSLHLDENIKCIKKKLNLSGVCDPDSLDESCEAYYNNLLNAMEELSKEGYEEEFSVMYLELLDEAREWEEQRGIKSCDLDSLIYGYRQDKKVVKSIAKKLEETGVADKNRIIIEAGNMGLPKPHTERILEESDLELQMQWYDSISPPCCALVLGKRRSGKSALCNWLLYLLSKKYNLEAFIVGMPKEKRSLLPDFITPLDSLDNLPENSIIFIDEASLKFYAKAYNTSEAKIMDHIVSLSGQRNQIILFATHTSRKFQASLLLDMDVLIFKEPSILHTRLERHEIKDLTHSAYKKFLGTPEKARKRYSYVFTADNEYYLENPLPS